MTLDGLSQILDQYRGRYNTIIGFSVRGSCRSHSAMHGVPYNYLQSAARWGTPCT